MAAGDPREPSRRVRLGVLTPVAIVISLAFTVPLLWMIGSSVRPADEILRYLSPLSARAIIPTAPTLDNFQRLLDGPFPRAVVNHVIVATFTVLTGLLICGMAAFGLSAPRFRHANALFAVVVVSFLIPFDAVAIPLAGLVRTWKLDNTYAGLILPGVGNGMAIFLLRQFFLEIPPDLREAARVDGAGWWTIFWTIYVRLSRPALVSAGLILFIFQWQAYLWPLLIISEQRLELAPVTLAKFLGQFDFDYGQLFAGALVIVVIPMLILLPLQRFFTQSVAHAGIKE